MRTEASFLLLPKWLHPFESPCGSRATVFVRICVWIWPLRSGTATISQMGRAAGHAEGIWWYGMNPPHANMSKRWFMTQTSAAVAPGGDCLSGVGGAKSRRSTWVLKVWHFPRRGISSDIRGNATSGALSQERIRYSSSVIWIFHCGNAEESLAPRGEEDAKRKPQGQRSRGSVSRPKWCAW